MANCQVATSTEWKDRESGERQSATEWHRCVAWGKLAELIGQYCRKGSAVYFEGKLRTRKWQDKDGADQYTTEIVVDEFINLDRRDAPEGEAKVAVPAPQAASRTPRRLWQATLEKRRTDASPEQPVMLRRNRPRRTQGSAQGRGRLLQGGFLLG